MTPPGITSSNRATPACVVIGSSAGGMKALNHILPMLPTTIPFPICIVQHLKAGVHHYICEVLNNYCEVPVCEVEDGMPLEAGHIYLAPPDYHILIENKTQLSLSVDEPIHFCRPSVDVLFESAADVFESSLLAIILTGMGSDGASGLYAVDQAGGDCIIQTPNTAEHPSMPQAALDLVPHANTLQLDDIYTHLMGE